MSFSPLSRSYSSQSEDSFSSSGAEGKSKETVATQSVSATDEKLTTIKKSDSKKNENDSTPSSPLLNRVRDRFSTDGKMPDNTLVKKCYDRSQEGLKALQEKQERLTERLMQVTYQQSGVKHFRN